MDEQIVLDLGRQALTTAFMVALPILAVALFLGLAVSVFQAMTQVQEMTLSFVPKIIGAALLFVLMGHWMLGLLVGFAQSCFDRIPLIGGG